MPGKVRCILCNKKWPKIQHIEGLTKFELAVLVVLSTSNDCSFERIHSRYFGIETNPVYCLLLNLPVSYLRYGKFKAIPINPEEIFGSLDPKTLEILNF